MLFNCIVWANNSESNTHAAIAIALRWSRNVIPSTIHTRTESAMFCETLWGIRSRLSNLANGCWWTRRRGCRHCDFGNSHLFNAGVGAVYTFDTEHELTPQSCMKLQKPEQWPVWNTSINLAAQAIMNHSVHVMLSGDGAETFAEQFVIERVDNTHLMLSVVCNLHKPKHVSSDKLRWIINAKNLQSGGCARPIR